MSLRLAAFYATIFLFVGVHMPFWPVWLESRGMSAAQIGLILSAATWTRAFIPPLVAHVADRRGERKRVIVFLLVCSVAAYLLYTVADGFWHFLVIGILAGVFLSSVIPLSENLTMLTAHERGLDYGRIRLWGSVTFIIGAGLGGHLLTGRGEDLILWLLLGTLALNAVSSLWLPDTRPPPARRAQAPALALMRNRGFLIFLATASMIQGSHAVYYGFASLHWRATGLSEGMIGALWAEGVVAEIVLFYFARNIMARLGPVKLMALAAAGGMLRWTVLGLTTLPAALFAIQTFHALTFAAAHLSAMHFLTHTVEREYSATAQSLYSGLAMGVVMGVAMIGAGQLYEIAAGRAFYAMAAMCTVALVMVPVMSRVWREAAEAAPP